MDVNNLETSCVMRLIINHLFQGEHLLIKCAVIYFISPNCLYLLFSLNSYTLYDYICITTYFVVYINNNKNRIGVKTAHLE